MERPFISGIRINHVRHLSGIEIPLSTKNNEPRHLIITGKNGSGKTSLLDALSKYIDSIATSTNLIDFRKHLKINEKSLSNVKTESDRIAISKRIKNYEVKIAQIENGLKLSISPSEDAIFNAYQNGNFIIAYYKAYRQFSPELSKQIETVELKDNYTVNEEPRNKFVKYLVALKTTEAFARNKNNIEKADSIKHWFTNFESVLKNIFDDESLKLEFNEDTFSFSIIEKGREPFDFTTLASGFSAVLDIIVDIIMRMEKKTERSFTFDIPGIVLIDEIETHLHLKLQKEILPLLTSLFPNVQFIVSTHSPFILNSLENVIIYDLENRSLVDEPNGLSDVPYSGIVEGYFKSDEMSDDLQKKFNRYKELAKKGQLTDSDLDEISKLELYLDEIPDFLALDVTLEYKTIKNDLRARMK